MIDIVVLAGGKGTRMKTNVPKCLVKVKGKEMIRIIIDEIEKINYEYNLSIVVGYKAKEVVNLLKHYYDELNYIYQDKQLGTGHALLLSKDLLKINTENIICIFCDMPFISKDIINNLIDIHNKSENDITLVTNILDNPNGYGRICEKQNKFRIIEENDLENEEKSLKEVNTGLFIGKKNIVFKLLSLVNNRNNNHEYYLSDIFKTSVDVKIGRITYDNENRLKGVNDLESLYELEKEINKSS